MDWNDVKTWTVLLVDDEPDNLEVVAESLAFYGIAVTTARNGLEGLERLKDFLPALVLLDLSMPKMDGWEMRKRMKDDPRTASIPVVALSAHAMSGDKERALDAGFDGYLTKPVNIPTLIQDLRATLAQTRAAAAPAEPRAGGNGHRTDAVPPANLPTFTLSETASL